MNEININLNENTFTNICKLGFIKYRSIDNTIDSLYLSSNDILSLYKEGILSKNINIENTLKLNTNNINGDIIKEIIKRSPVYSNLNLNIDD